MIWPPVKAWTSKCQIENQVHFVAINYGGKLTRRWVILMSVLDSNVVLKAYWPELIDISKWESGWDENDCSNFSKLADNKRVVTINGCVHPSIDSGLTIPITKNIIRPWFSNF